MLLMSCSIKEDRDGCPCWMTVDLSEITGRVGHDGSVVLRLRGNSDEDAMDYAFKMAETLNTEVGTLEYEVPRGSIGVSVVNSARLVVPVGEQMDSLYGFFKPYHTRCESVKCDVELHKEFCTVSFTLVDEHYESPYDIEVRGNVSGVSPWDLVPVSGAFKYAPVAEEGVYRLRVPRQVDASLEMVMLSNQEIVNRLPLGKYIIRSGYDWSAKDLSDVSVALDLKKQQVMVTVSGWDGVVMMDIVI